MFFPHVLLIKVIFLRRYLKTLVDFFGYLNRHISDARADMQISKLQYIFFVRSTWWFLETFRHIKLLITWKAAHTNYRTLFWFFMLKINRCGEVLSNKWLEFCQMVLKNTWKRHQKFKVTIVVADNAWNIGPFYNQTSMGDETEEAWWCSFSQL